MIVSISDLLFCLYAFASAPVIECPQLIDRQAGNKSVILTFEVNVIECVAGAAIKGGHQFRFQL